jgi:hypothetical protein
VNPKTPDFSAHLGFLVATAYHQLNRARELKSLRKRAKLLGFELVDRSSGEVLLNPVS